MSDGSRLQWISMVTLPLDMYRRGLQKLSPDQTNFLTQVTDVYFRKKVNNKASSHNFASGTNSQFAYMMFKEFYIAVS
jgi:hypothetical protein